MENAEEEKRRRRRRKLVLGEMLRNASRGGRKRSG